MSKITIDQFKEFRCLKYSEIINSLNEAKYLCEKYPDLKDNFLIGEDMEFSFNETIVTLKGKLKFLEEMDFFDLGERVVIVTNHSGIYKEYAKQFLNETLLHFNISYLSHK